MKCTGSQIARNKVNIFIYNHLIDRISFNFPILALLLKITIFTLFWLSSAINITGSCSIFISYLITYLISRYYIIILLRSYLIYICMSTRWAQLSIQLALSCSSRHYAGRSLQIFRALKYVLILLLYHSGSNIGISFVLFINVL